MNLNLYTLEQLARFKRAEAQCNAHQRRVRHLARRSREQLHSQAGHLLRQLIVRIVSVRTSLALR